MRATSFSLAGCGALVTGGARRLGRALCESLAGAGARVALHYGTSREEAEALAGVLRQGGVDVRTFQADLAQPDEAAALVPRVCEAMGPLDVLVNSASIFQESRLDSFTPEELRANVDIHAVAPALLGRAFAAQGRPGAILNLLDCRMVDYDRNHVAYHLSKRMLHALTVLMALEYAPAIRVNAVAPGLILPPEGRDESYLAGLAESNPLCAWGGPEDVCRAALFLLESPFITGQVVFVDGGRHLRGNVYG